MNNTKRKDSGFSLVELVIVILIMAIVATALAPQVMKWVNNSRISMDLQLRDSMISCAQYAVSDPSAYTQTQGKQIQIKIDDSGCEALVSSYDSGADTEIEDYVRSFASYAEKEYERNGSSFTIKDVKTKTAGAIITIYVTKGSVSSVVNNTLSSEDLGTEGESFVVSVNPVWDTFVMNYTPSGTGGSISAGTGGTSGKSPASALHADKEPHVDATTGQYYLDGTLIVTKVEDLENVKLEGETLPIWVYVGLNAAQDEKYDEVILYRCTKDGSGNIIWTKELLNGLD